MKTKLILVPTLLLAGMLTSSGVFAQALTEYSVLGVTTAQLVQCLNSPSCHKVYVKFTYTGKQTAPPSIAVSLYGMGSQGQPKNSTLTPTYGSFQMIPGIYGGINIPFWLTITNPQTTAQSPKFTTDNKILPLTNTNVLCLPISIGDNGSGGFTYTFGASSFSSSC